MIGWIVTDDAAGVLSSLVIDLSIIEFRITLKVTADGLAYELADRHIVLDRRFFY